MDKIDITDIDATQKNEYANKTTELEELPQIDEPEEIKEVEGYVKEPNEDVNLNLEIEELNDDIEEEESKELKEVELDIQTNDNTLESLKLKRPNQVYFEIYKEARTRAKEAKKNAILAYLEAKNIKKTYMIENINDSDSDFDAEIDEVSESELEGL